MIVTVRDVGNASFARISTHLTALVFWVAHAPRTKESRALTSKTKIVRRKWRPPMNEPVKLKSCPFCGGEAQIEDWDVGHESGTTILCRKCCACISESVVDGDGWHDRAVEKWNRRAERTGRWIALGNGYFGCSVCHCQQCVEDKYGNPMAANNPEHKQCPCCGAHMIRGAEHA